jgi:hypothetical protein
MISLKEFLEIIDYSITEGWQYQWHCFGDNAYALDYHDPDRSKNSFTIVFDKKDRTVYCAEAHDYENNRSYRLLHPAHAQAYQAECTAKGIKDMAWDDVAYTDLETDEDWLEKARAIFAGEPYDTRVSVPLDFTDEELLKYMVAAHERDMTFNQFVEAALREAIEEHRRDPEAFKSRADLWKSENAGD